MDSYTSPILNWVIVLFAFVGVFQHSNGQGFSLQLHHKFSEQVKTWMNLKHGMDRGDWPAEGSTEYYNTLYHHDNVRHGRNLKNYPSLTFADGNETVKLKNLGFLYYTSVQLGTPNVSLFVALDTGSDLFWVPCECKQCSSLTLSSNKSNITLATYTPSASQTFKPVTCASDLCSLSNSCSKSTDQCPYNISYVSDNTSSSGTLVEDVLYLTPGDGRQNGEVVKARITFGCGSIQTGSFIDGAAPDGLLGLGIENISVPTILSNTGFVGNYFSMCFPSNGSFGRFTFGYKGSSDQKQTSFIIDPKRPAYNVGVKEFHVGEKLISTGFQALFDTGTSFTYLADPAYKDLTSNFHLQISDSPITIEGIPFEYCYSVSDNQSMSSAPEISFTFNGGENFTLIHPFLLISDGNTGQLVAYCLAVIQSSSMTIIGQNFMSGYEIVFDREELKLGWKPSSCYQGTYSNSPEASPGPVAVNSSEISRRPSISPAALPANPVNSSGAVHMNSPFLQFAFSILTSATILTLI
ncbi:hypothetical protein SUGI_0478820 [Cryptomeria japonica]|nr:hypothetical protein SUGI_0478820 [Cryptomeria japonica]